jgi:DMSO/TMAO reductase YedYZ heme-binding membrane subunit/nitrite reductase/ring-hydroxylating ferredoxin subunit
LAPREDLRLYDAGIAGLLLVCLTCFAAVTFLLRPATTAETFVIRFTAVIALILLHVVLAIGPLARLDRRFLPLLYNRRHLGVSLFLLALIHGVFAIVQFHAGGDLNPLASVLTAYRRDYLSGEISQFPFEPLGLAALVILFVMAATSHDFWLRNLGASFWKTMHMLVYVAYGLIVAHVCLGALQSERAPALAILLAAGFFVLISLHLAAFAKERKLDRVRAVARADGFVKAARVEELSEGIGHVAMCGDQRVALFLEQGRIYALSNVCRHQGGPLGEGKIVNGCLTCPWHGYQYRVEDGCSPPPFTEVAPTYAVQVIDEEIFVQCSPLPLRTRSDGAPSALARAATAEEFYIGWQSKAPPGLRRFTLAAFAAILLLAVGAVTIAAIFQNPIDPGSFEYGVVRDFEGILHESPLPLLQVTTGAARDSRNFLLCGAGKFGPPAVIQGHGGQRVRFKGSLIERQGVSMIEMNAPSSFTVLNATPEKLPAALSLGTVTFKGELVDTKCFLGVMRPAVGKVHRACAVRCLSGGVPPGLLVRDEHGNGVVLLLVGATGGKLDLDVELAARVLEVRGKLEIENGTPILRVASWKLSR